MVIVLAVIGTIVIALAVDRFRDKQGESHHTKIAAGIHRASKVIPHALTMVVMVAHASEITRVVSHISWPHLAAAFGLFMLWMLTNSVGSEV